MWSFFRVHIGLKFYFDSGNPKQEAGKNRFGQPYFESKEVIFTDLSSLFNTLQELINQVTNFTIKVFINADNEITISSSDIISIEKKVQNKVVIEIKLTLKGTINPVIINDPTSVSIVYSSGRPGESSQSRLPQDKKEALEKYPGGTIGSVLQEYFPDGLANLQGWQIESTGELIGLRGNLSDFVLIIIEKDSVPPNLATLNQLFSIKLLMPYEGTNLPNVWIIPVSRIAAIELADNPRFVQVSWSESRKDLQDQQEMVFYFPDHQFFIVGPKEKLPTNAGSNQPQTHSVAAAETQGVIFTRAPTLREVLLGENNLSNLDNINIEIAPKDPNGLSGFLSLLNSQRKNVGNSNRYYLVIFEETLVKSVKRPDLLQSLLNLRFIRDNILVLNVINLSQIREITLKTFNQTIFGVSVSWSENDPKGGIGTKTGTMIYPISNYQFVLIELPDTQQTDNTKLGPSDSNQDLLEQLLLSPSSDN